MPLLHTPSATTSRGMLCDKNRMAAKRCLLSIVWDIGGREALRDKIFGVRQYCGQPLAVEIGNILAPQSKTTPESGFGQREKKIVQLSHVNQLNGWHVKCRSADKNSRENLCILNQLNNTMTLMTAVQRREIFRRLAISIPEPTTELKHGNTFELLVAVILSAQATDKGVNIATAKLFPVANTPQAILDLGIEGLEAYIKTIGLYHAKAKNIIATCRMLVEQHGGQVPDTREALESLPGVGRKTANVILNTAFGQPTIAVDTHIFRVGNRTGLAPGKTVLEVEQNLLKAVPKEYLLDAHHLLILHGRYTCTARKPKCGDCVINDLCRYGAKL